MVKILRFQYRGHGLIFGCGRIKKLTKVMDREYQERGIRGMLITDDYSFIHLNFVQCPCISYLIIRFKT